ncbi:MAG: thioesterase family protein [Acidimicrobiia bacterium]
MPPSLEQQIHASPTACPPLHAGNRSATTAAPRSERGRFDRLFGGQQLGAGVHGRQPHGGGQGPHSLHAYFVEGGTPEEPIDLVVERVRDGRSMSTRRVTLQQGSRTLLTAIARSTPTDSPAMDLPRPDAPHPDDLPRLQEWVHGMLDERRPFGMTWVDVPPPLDMRIGEPLDLPAVSRPMATARIDAGAATSATTCAARRALAHASDYFLLDMVFRTHPEDIEHGAWAGSSLDHSVWIHRPVRFDEWLLHNQRTLGIVGHRGLVQGTLHDEQGRLVATVMQEVLARPR